MESATNLSRRPSVLEPQEVRPKKVDFKLQNTNVLSRNNTGLSLRRQKQEAEAKAPLPQPKVAIKSALKKSNQVYVGGNLESLPNTTTLPLETTKAATVTEAITSVKNNKKQRNNIKAPPAKTYTTAPAYHFINEITIDQCRKWERLQERAAALEKHKKLLSELRWKMALNSSSRRGGIPGIPKEPRS